MMGGVFVHTVLGLVDMISSFTMMVCAQILTVKAGLPDSEARWALGRRFLYTSAWVALFILGIWRFDNIDSPANLGEAVPHFVLVIYIMAFPLLRVTGIISQDHVNNLPTG